MGTELSSLRVCDVIHQDNPVNGYREGFPEKHAKELSSRSALRRRIYDLKETMPELACNPQTQLGIEVEVENIILREEERFRLVPWAVKKDGSLRNNGVEFISLPIRPEDLQISLATLYGWFSQSKQNPDFSGRTSIHMHLDASRLSIEEYQKLLLLYLTFEESLFEFARPGRRETNIFCTPLARTKTGYLGNVVRAKSAKDFVSHLKATTNQIQKYSAVNLSHIFHYGTIEFRHLGGEESPHKVMRWGNLLLRLFDATKMDMKQIREAIISLNTDSTYQAFAQTVFGRQANDLDFIGRDAFMARGVTLCKELLSETKLPTPKGKRGIDLFFEKEEGIAKNHMKAAPLPPDAAEIPVEEDAPIPRVNLIDLENNGWRAPAENLWGILIDENMDIPRHPKRGNVRGKTKRQWIRHKLFIERHIAEPNLDRARNWAISFDRIEARP